MARPRKDPVKAVLRALLDLTTEQRNALDVALTMIEEFAPALGGKPQRRAVAPKSKTVAPDA